MNAKIRHLGTDLNDPHAARTLCGKKTIHAHAHSYGSDPPGKCALASPTEWRDDAVSGGRAHGAPCARCPACVAELARLGSLAAEQPRPGAIQTASKNDAIRAARAYVSAVEAPPPAVDAVDPRAGNAQIALRASYRSVVDHDGHDLIRFLGLAHEWVRRELFELQIMPALVLLTPPASARALADYAERDPHGVRSLIRISPSVAKRGDLRYLADVLLHEIVHSACAEIDMDREPGYRGHGPLFAARCNAIGARLGLPRVFVKGRIPEAEREAAQAAQAELGGEGAEPPDSARWPICVRPADYYGPPPPKGRPLNHGRLEPKEPPTEPTEDGDEGEAEDEGAAPKGADAAALAAALGAVGGAIVAGDHELAGRLARGIRAALSATLGEGWRAGLARAALGGGR